MKSRIDYSTISRDMIERGEESFPFFVYLKLDIDWDEVLEYSLKVREGVAL